MRAARGVLLILCLALSGAALAALPLPYRNEAYGFSFDLPPAWTGYTVVETRWQSAHADAMGPEVDLIYPEKGPPTGDHITTVRLLVFTREQWNDLTHDVFEMGASSALPQVVARNSKYLIALPPRWYNYGDGIIAGFDTADLSVFHGFEP